MENQAQVLRYLKNRIELVKNSARRYKELMQANKNNEIVFDTASNNLNIEHQIIIELTTVYNMLDPENAQSTNY